MTGSELIAAERQRQVEVEGWTPEHDDGHRYGHLAIQAASLAVSHTDAFVSFDGEDKYDPWELASKHSADQIRSLVIAGALIAAEIDRRQRAARLESEGGKK